MVMIVYNTLTKKKEEFIPLEEGKVRMYVCGPTVYNYIHIGNARPVIVFDTVRRYLEYKGYEVNFVSNFTDVDDKIIKKAIEEGITATEISERYIKEYLKDLKELNVKPATANPKATEEIPGMIEMIQSLIDKGHAYEKNGTVYFKTRSFKEYGKLSKKNLDDLSAGIRIAVSDEKEDPVDFVLWKPKKEGEPFWESPWSEGRPGWHIECSVMSKHYLGDQIDIHAGGEDLVFPHHENEIAQSECCNGKEFAKYWLHNAFLNIDNKKMSKSEGNFFTVREIGEQYPLSVLRFFMLNAHYDTTTKEAMTAEEERVLEEVSQLHKKFEDSMDDDFNTADAIAVIFEIVKVANSNLNVESSKEVISKVLNKIIELADVLGIVAVKREELLDEEIEQLIEDRQNARKNKDFNKADEIRNLLLEKGIVLEDTREGVRWKRA